MNQPGPAARVTSEARVSAFYFTQFMSGGAATAYAGIWFSDRGLTEGQIGLLASVPVLVLLILNLSVGRLADRAKDWRQVIVTGAVVSALFPFGLFLAGGFWSILFFWSLSSVAQAAIVPVADAAAMRVTRRRGTDFGTVRAWGTIGYLLVILLTGYLAAWYGGGIFLPVFAGLSLLRAIAAFGLPNMRAQPGEKAIRAGASRLLHVMKPWFLLPLIGWSMVFATHLILNAFQSLLWSQQGISPQLIGILIALGAVSETVMFFAFRRFSHRYSARSLILISCLTTVLRWIALALSPPVWVLFPLQLLHAVTYALGFLGCVNFIANWTSEDIAAEAQSFFVVLQLAAATLALAAFGWLAARYGAHAYFASAAFAAVGAALVWASLRMQAVRK